MFNKISHRVSLRLSVILTICFIHRTETAPPKIFGGMVPGTQNMEIRLTAASIEVANPNYLGKNVYVRVARTSRDAPPSLNAFFPFVKDLPRDVNNTYIAYQKMSNKWRESFVRGSIPLCEVLSSKIPFYRQYFYDFTTFPKKCPVRAGNYTIDNLILTKGEVSSMANQEWKIKLGYVAVEGPILIFTFECRLEPRKGSGKPSHANH